MKADLQITTIVKNSRTILADCYFSPPFKVMNITENKQEPLLHLMMMSSSPGILDGDDYNINIDVKEDSLLHLHTQSYQRLFNMQVAAKQQMELHIHAGATFIYLPHPVTPHKNSDFTSRNNFYLSNEATLIWAEIFTCGRILNGEIFQFTKYHSITKIYINNKLVLKENILMEPKLLNPQLMGQMEGYTHQANLIFLKSHLNLEEKIITTKHILSQIKDISYGISKPATQGFIVRILGFKAEQLHNLVKQIAASLY